MPATWLSRQLFAHFAADRVLEEMDQLELEARILEHEDSDDVVGIQKTGLLGITVASIGTTVIWKRREIWDNSNVAWILGVGAGITVVLGGTVAVGQWYLRWKTRTIRRLTGQMDRTRAVMRKRRQVMFSVSMRSLPHRNPLICRACRLVVSAIESLSRETIALNSESWTDLYTDEIRIITARSRENPEKLAIEEGEEEMDWEVVMETLTSIFKLHASEYSRVVVTDFLEKFNFRKFWKFLGICAEMRDLRKRMEVIESLALRKSREARDGDRRRDAEKRDGLEIGWKQQTGMALEAVLEGLHSDSLTRSEVELALRRTLVIIGTESALKSENPVEKIDRKLMENGGETGDSVVFVKEERCDVDMVFEGIPLSEADKLASRSACARDALLDGSESRRHEASLMGELQMVLEPRRTDFEKRERKALAKWYGVEEEQLEQPEEEKKGENREETFSGIGIGGDGSADPEPYDWRKDAETSSGLHQEADNIDFLNFLASRRVQDDVIE